MTEGEATRDTIIGQALAARWMFFTANVLHNHIGVAMDEFGYGIPSAGPHALQRDLKSLTLLEAHLAERQRFELDWPTLADLSIYPLVAVAPEAGIDPSPYANVAEWFARFGAVPGFISMPRLRPDRAPQA